jgi:hypothetical protein
VSPAKRSTKVPGTSVPTMKADKCDPKKLFEPISLNACRIGEFLRQEWARKARGQRSCLDLERSDCDWSPMMFEARFVQGLPYIDEQHEHEEHCVKWTGDNMGSPKPANLTAAEAYIAKQKRELEEALNELKAVRSTSGGTSEFGKYWEDGDHFGDKDAFAAGYDYKLGFDVAAVASANNNVCELAGGAIGRFGISGWFIGNEFEVVDAEAAAEYNRNTKKDGHYDAHLRVFGMSTPAPLFDDADDFSGAWEQAIGSAGWDIPTGYKPSFTIMAGFVPITGAVWGEFFLGAKLGLEAITEAGGQPPNCNMDQLKFGAKTTFTPEVGLNAKAQIGIGISGLMSAGVRGLVNLVTLGVPVQVGLTKSFDTVKRRAQLDFDLSVKLALSTLSGWLAVYVEFLFFEEEFVLFRWSGLGPEEIDLLGKPIKVKLPLFVMAQGK